ncbi:HAD-IA family hydrolase [Thalassotalea sp. PLHSN55]|uniref:HAD-IA family hydrolase n=1 Tax=Thalassotalea sp. PLHSN55 TaxID=3435888 RepID=UPI003F86AFC7
MQCYRRLSQIKALSFDLDDTLYANHPIMLAAYEKMVQFFNRELGGKQNYDFSFWFTFRNQAIINNPELKHDVAAARQQSYYLGLQHLGYKPEEALALANKALAYFVEVRSDFTVPAASHQLLADLAEKFPLAAISNGNVDTKAIGIADYFSVIFHAGDGLKQKPDAHMFELAARQLQLAPEHILHVGDCGKADVQGAVLAGYQTAWLPHHGIGKSLALLPNIEINDITELRCLL